jgi:hypothetical protein
MAVEAKRHDIKFRKIKVNLPLLVSEKRATCNQRIGQYVAGVILVTKRK